MAQLHVTQEFADRLGIGAERGGPHDVTHGLEPFSVREVVDALGHILEVNGAHHVIEILSDDGDAGESRTQSQREQLPQCLVSGHEDHIRAWHHDLFDDGVAQFEDRVDHPGLARLDELLRFREVDHVAQFGLGSERAIRVATARCHGIAQIDHELGDGAQHRGERRQEGPEEAKGGLRLLSADGAWRHSPEDE